MTDQLATPPLQSGMEPDHGVLAWKISRIDLRSPIGACAWPVARLELEHPSRGRVTDIASAPGAFDAVFLAASQILNICPNLLSYNVRSASKTAEHALAVYVDIELEIDGKVYRGSSFGVDLAQCSLSAWLQAASRLGEKMLDDHSAENRAFQVSGVDSNGNLWIFASVDQRTAQAVATEFARDDYQQIKILGPAKP